RRFCIANVSFRARPIIFCSEAFSELTGYSRVELPVTSSSGPLTSVESITSLRDSLEINAEHLVHITLYRKDEHFWLASQIFCLSSIPSLLRRRNPLTRGDTPAGPHTAAAARTAAPFSSSPRCHEALRRRRTWPVLMKQPSKELLGARPAVGTGLRAFVAAGTDEEPEDDTIVFSQRGESGYATLRRNMSEKVAQMLSRCRIRPDARLQAAVAEGAPAATILHLLAIQAVWDWLILILVIYTAIIFTPYVAGPSILAQRRQEADRKLKWTTPDPMAVIDILVDVMFIWRRFPLICCLPGSGSTSDETTTLIGLFKTARLLRLVRVASQTRPVFANTEPLCCLLLMASFALIAHWLACIWLRHRQSGASWRSDWLA
uniref:Ion_trans domain-containing protein n=1 Tax=Macrostomum lignano TaxID=282301 RepID=A0A1I8F7K9_9PLAT